MARSAAVVETTCGNCGAELAGAFCHVCGQKATGPDISLHDFFHEAFHEFAHLDGKIVQTLRLLLTKPGLLTREFLSGRRARYVSPLRLYLTCSLLFFALAAFTPDERLSCDGRGRVVVRQSVRNLDARPTRKSELGSLRNWSTVTKIVDQLRESSGVS
jgi:hypothetical protein